MDFVVPGAETEPRVCGAQMLLVAPIPHKLKAQVDCCLGTCTQSWEGQNGSREGGNSIHANSMLRSCAEMHDSGISQPPPGD